MVEFHNREQTEQSLSKESAVIIGSRTTPREFHPYQTDLH